MTGPAVLPRGLGDPMKGLAVLMRGLGTLRTANTSRLRPFPQGLSSVAKGVPGKQVLPLYVLADSAYQLTATHSMAEIAEVLVAGGVVLVMVALALASYAWYTRSSR